MLFPLANKPLTIEDLFAKGNSISMMMVQSCDGAPQLIRVRVLQKAANEKAASVTKISN